MKRTERGWIGHYICADRCLFRRNTLLELGDIRVVISTVGGQWDKRERKLEKIGSDRYYETKAFHAKFEDVYWEADVQKEINFDSNWSINDPKTDSNVVNDMHETVVDEIVEKLLSGQIENYEVKYDDW